MTTYALTPTDLSRSTTTVRWGFATKADGALLRLGDPTTGGYALTIENGSLFLRGQSGDAPVNLDMEDTVGVSDGEWHSIVITTGDFGSKIYLDGYQCFSATANLAPGVVAPEGTEAPSHYELHESPALSTRGFTFTAETLSDTDIVALSARPEPLIEFAASGLSLYDVKQVGELRSGTIYLRFRVRGPGQIGPILAAAGDGREQMRVDVDGEGIRFQVMGRDGQWRVFPLTGTWDEGHWHDVIIRAARGAIDIYIDGYMEGHFPGQPFFADIVNPEQILIGLDTTGWKLSGEVRNAAIYSTALSEGQIKQLSGVAPLPTECLFDFGYENSVSYRIPSLLTTTSGVVIAGADQRETFPNDAPNSINFVVRRSFDGGCTWGPLQTVISYPGHGPKGASVIDSCIVQDASTGRVIVLIDHFPGAIGQPNNELGVGVDDQGNFLLYDREGQEYVWLPDGSVVTRAGEPTDYTVSRGGDVNYQGTPAGNVFLADGEDPAQSLLTKRTCFLQMVYSDDDGATWSEPVNLDHQVKEPWMAFLGTAPGTGIQLRHSAHKGRLLIPVYFNTAVASSFSCAVVYSDDGGQTWTRSGSPNDGRVFNGETIDSRTFTDQLAATHESTLVERADGSILLLMRNQHPCGRVAFSVSEDGGETWGPVGFDETLTEIFCQPNAVSVADAEHPDRVVFANAAQLRPYRGRGVLRLSDDGGRTWRVSRTFNPHHYVYQCMAVMPRTECGCDTPTIGLLWEREMQGLYFSRVPLTWFE